MELYCFTILIQQHKQSYIIRWSNQFVKYLNLTMLLFTSSDTIYENKLQWIIYIYIYQLCSLYFCTHTTPIHYIFQKNPPIQMNTDSNKQIKIGERGGVQILKYLCLGCSYMLEFFLRLMNIKLTANIRQYLQTVIPVLFLLRCI